MLLAVAESTAGCHPRTGSGITYIGVGLLAEGMSVVVVALVVVVTMPSIALALSLGEESMDAAHGCDC